MNEVIERAARAMKERASQPVGNLPSLDGVLVGSMGDAWPYLAHAAIEAMREPTEAMIAACHNATVFDDHYTGLEYQEQPVIAWRAMIDELLRATKPVE